MEQLYYDTERTPNTQQCYYLSEEEKKLIGTRFFLSTDDKVKIWFNPVDLNKYSRSFDDNGFPILVEYELKEDGTRSTHYKEVVNGFRAIDADKEKEAKDAIIAQAQEEAKEEAIERIQVTVTSGKVFYADPTSRADLADAIDLMQEEGLVTYLWKTINGIMEVTLDDMKEARKLGLLEKGRLVGVE